MTSTRMDLVTTDLLEGEETSSSVTSGVAKASVLLNSGTTTSSDLEEDTYDMEVTTVSTSESASTDTPHSTTEANLLFPTAEYDLYLNTGTTTETEPIGVIESGTTTLHRQDDKMYVTTARDDTTAYADLSPSLSPHHDALAGVSGTLLESSSTTLFPTTVTRELTTKPITSQVCIN